MPQKILCVLFFVCFALVSHSQKIRVVQNSRIAKLAARIKGEDPNSYAITFGRTIFVSCKKEDFFAKKWWVKHEVTHVTQYQKYGIFHFLSLYFYYTIVHHYSENPLEVEAEEAEFSKD